MSQIHADSPDLEAYARRRLKPHRDLLKRLAGMDTELSDDARRALVFLDETDPEGDQE